MKILLLGGTGAMGMSLAPILAARGNDVFITSRNRRENVGEQPVHYLRGNAHFLPFLKEILEEHYDVIVDFMVYSVEEFSQRLDLLMTSTGQYIFLSSARVYADSSEPIKEDSMRLLDICADREYLSQKEYALLKAQEENLLYKSGYGNWTIIRPYITYNTNRLQLGVFEKEDWLYRAMHGRTIVFQKDVAEHVTTLTYGYDVAKVMAELVGNTGALGETVHITSQESIKWQEVLELYLKVIEEKTGNRPKVIYLLDSGKLATFMRNIYQVKYDRLFDRVFDNKKAVKLYGKELNCTSPREGLRRCLEALLESGSMNKISWKTQGYMDRITGEKTPFGEITDWKDRIYYLLCRYMPGLYMGMRSIKLFIRRR